MENSRNKNIAMLVEERGVAGVMYDSIANKILKYIKDYTIDEYVNGTFKTRGKVMFDIPKGISEEIDFIQYFDIHITVYEKGMESLQYSGGGNIRNIAINTEYDPRMMNGKVFYACMNVTCYSYNGVVQGRTFKNTFYHELNHLYEKYFRLVNTGNDKSFVRTAGIANIHFTSKKFSNIHEYDSVIKDIIYRIVSDTELNALVASAYGDLSGFNSKRENFRKDIKLTAPYYIYKYIKNNYVNAINSMTIEQISDLMGELKNYSVTLKTNNPEIFRERFKKFVSERLDKLVRKIGSAASCWYDRSEGLIDDNLLTEVNIIIDKNEKIALE